MLEATKLRMNCKQRSRDLESINSAYRLKTWLQRIPPPYGKVHGGNLQQHIPPRWEDTFVGTSNKAFATHVRMYMDGTSGNTVSVKWLERNVD